MHVSRREEALAKELYENDMNLHQSEDVPWHKTIQKVQDSYRRQAMRIVNTKWFKAQMEEARSEKNSDNRLP